jgi:hypothetical protein
VPIMLVGEPMVAVLLGVVVLGEYLTVRGPAALGLAAAIVAMIVATVALARDEAPKSGPKSAPVPPGQQPAPTTAVSGLER